MKKILIISLVLVTGLDLFLVTQVRIAHTAVASALVTIKRQNEALANSNAAMKDLMEADDKLKHADQELQTACKNTLSLLNTCVSSRTKKQ
jgi:hypothetical protein